MDWWEGFSFADINIIFTPVQHWSARSLTDKRKTLWGGFYIKGERKIFFAGDTGYGKLFKLIREKFGDTDIGLIPIGAYEPRWFMKYAHLNPSDAVQVYKDMALKKAFGIHFATFEGLTDEPRDRPAKDLSLALKEAKLSVEDFIVPEFGKVYNLH